VLSTIDISIIYGYLAFMVLLGFYASFRQENAEDFYVAGRRLSAFSIGCLWLATWVGGASILGTATRAYELGVTAIWYVVSLALGCLLFGLLFAARVKKQSDRHGFMTYPDLMEQSFDVRTRITATLTTSVASIAFVASQLVAAAAIMQVLLGWDFEVSLVVAGAVVIVYTSTGGFLAVTYTDWVQFLLLFVGVVIIGFPIALGSAGSWGDLRAALPAGHFELGAWGWATVVPLSISIILSFFVSMDSFTRCYAARSPAAARNGAFLAVVFMLPIAIAATWLGLASATLFPGVENTSGILVTFVMELFPAGLKGLVLVGILAAVMSTADISLLVVSANLTQDIYKRFVNPDVSHARMKWLGTTTSLVAGILAMLLALHLRDIIDALMLAFTLTSAGMFLPTVLALYARRRDPSAAFWSTTLALAAVIFWYVASEAGWDGVFEINPLWAGLGFSFAVYGLLSLASTKRR
jgi:SSS family solute:Na+ symporter